MHKLVPPRQLLDEQFADLMGSLQKGASGNQASLLHARRYLTTIMEHGHLNAWLDALDRSEAEVASRVENSFAVLTEAGKRAHGTVVKLSEELDETTKGALREISNDEDWYRMAWLLPQAAPDDRHVIRQHVDIEELLAIRTAFVDLVETELTRDLNTARPGLALLRRMARGADGSALYWRAAKVSFASAWYEGAVGRSTWRRHGSVPVPSDDAVPVVLQFFHQTMVEQMRIGLVHAHHLHRYNDWVSRLEFEDVVAMLDRFVRDGGQDEHELCRHLASYLHICGLDPWTEAWLGPRRADVVARLGPEAIAIEVKLVRAGDDKGAITARLADGIYKASTSATAMNQQHGYLVVYWCDASEPSHPLLVDPGSAVVCIVIDLRAAWSSFHARRRMKHARLIARRVALGQAIPVLTRKRP